MDLGVEIVIGNKQVTVGTTAVGGIISPVGITRNVQRRGNQGNRKEWPKEILKTEVEGGESFCGWWFTEPRRRSVEAVCSSELTPLGRGVTRGGGMGGRGKAKPEQVTFLMRYTPKGVWVSDLKK